MDSQSRTCHRKIRHRDLESARKALAGSIEQTGELALVYYRCGNCGFYHIGHPDKQTQKNLRVMRLCELIDKANEKDHHAREERTKN